MVKLAALRLCLPVFPVLLLLPQDVCSARFLVIIPTPVKSHFVMLEPYMKALAARGHKLVVVSYFPQKQPVPNYTDIALEVSSNWTRTRSSISIEHVVSIRNPLVNVIYLAKYGANTCEAVLSCPSIGKLIKSDEKFDVVVNDVFHTDCFLPFAYKFGAISIGVSTSVIMPWANARFGNPDNPSYIPNLFTSFSDKMNLFERVVNAVTLALYKVIYHFLSESESQQLARLHFGVDTPDLDELSRNMSLILVNSHFSLNAPRPLVPGIVEVGGLHIPEPKPLPQVRQVLMCLSFFLTSSNQNEVVLVLTSGFSGPNGIVNGIYR
jgi:glucuronosyltransferase